MMRPNLHLINERRRHRHGSRDASTTTRRPSGPQRGRRSESSRVGSAPAAIERPGNAPRDEATRRVREAGGPVDQGFYSCSCGLMFEAPVSTTVSCPHCGDSQAW
jgi:hypothetical protein